MNNRGFTLIELLAVIVILSSLSIIAINGINKSIINRNKKECDEQVAMAISAAKVYFSLNNVEEVSVEALRNNEYLTNLNKTSRLKNKDTITFTHDGTYVYSNTQCE